MGSFVSLESKTLGGLYVRYLGGRAYAVTHGNAIFEGESHIRYTIGEIIEVPESGNWAIYVEPAFNPEAPGHMFVKFRRPGGVPDWGLVITDISAE